jgi:hypothetical protein
MLEHGPIAERRVREVLSTLRMRLPGFWTTAAGEESWIPEPRAARAFPSAEIVGLETSANAL